MELGTEEKNVKISGDKPIKFKGHWHEILELCFFHKSIVPRFMSHSLKYFRFRGDIRENISDFWVTIPGSQEKGS